MTARQKRFHHPVMNERQEQLHAVGQEIVNLMARRGEEIDLTLIDVLVLLCSITGHYIGGVPVGRERQRLFDDFTGNLAGHIDDTVERDAGANVVVTRQQ